jgi:tetratricopeptide (TPR) repeat protein
MHRNIFSPQVTENKVDTLSDSFFSVARWIFGATLALLPLWCLPQVAVSLGFIKTSFAAFGVYLAVVFLLLALLRSGKFTFRLPFPILLFWFFALGTLISAYLSGDVWDSLFGDGFEVTTASFTVLLAAVLSLPLMFVGARSSLIRVLLLVLVSVVGVYLHTLARIIFGADVLSFGIFSTSTQTLVGTLNEAALYAGMVLIGLLSLISKLPATPRIRFGVGFLTVVSLSILAVADFSFVWVVVGVASGLTFLYLLAKDTWLDDNESNRRFTASSFSLVIVASICLVSGAFIVSGGYLSGKAAEMTNISYLEVRPSLSATIGVLESVYRTDALTGIGPNRFADAWRLHKESQINETQFWNTTFDSGVSYVSTVFVTTGLLGGMFFIGFIALFLHTGYTIVRRLHTESSSWNIIGLLVLSIAVYLWLMTFWYTPGPTILLLTVFFTGLAVAAAESHIQSYTVAVNVKKNRQYGFIFISGVFIALITSTFACYLLAKQVTGQLTLLQGVAIFNEGGDLAEYDRLLAEISDTVSAQDTYPAERARLRLAELNRLLSLSEVRAEDQQLFEKALVEGVGFAETAIGLDATNPFNYALLGSLYGLVNVTDVAEIADRREMLFTKAQTLDPQNPEYALLKAQIASRVGDTAGAKAELARAVSMKRDYTEALFALSQLEIQEGNATSAIATTRAIIAIEPNNPARHFQLGLLLLATEDRLGAGDAFLVAVTIDPEYANARYMLALTLLDLGKPNEALEQLKMVATANQDNQELLALIAQIEAGDYTNPGVGDRIPLPTTEQSEKIPEVSVSSNLETTLVSPVNRMSADDVTGVDTIVVPERAE